MTTRRTTFTEIITAAVESGLQDNYHALPGIVVAYYPDTQEADIQIAIDDPRFDTETFEREDEPWPVWPKMRVAWPRFGGYVIAGPLNAGDKVQILWNDLDDGNFRATGQQGPTGNTRRHGSGGAFCVPWDLTDGGELTDHAKASAGLLIGKDGGVTQILMDGTHITLGSVGADFVALASKVDAAATLIANAFNNHTHVAPSGGGATGPPTPTASVTPAPTGSTLVKSD